jgi:hypothetical protein
MTERANLTDTLREILSGHQMLTIPPLHSSLTEWNVGCLCGWESKCPDVLHGYAAYATHLSERMYAALGLVSVITQTAQQIRRRHCPVSSLKGEPRYCGCCDEPWPCFERIAADGILGACQPAPKDNT